MRGLTGYAILAVVVGGLLVGALEWAEIWVFAVEVSLGEAEIYSVRD